MEKFVDVKKLISGKNKKLADKLPRFVIRWLENLLHQEEINQFMIDHKNDDPFTFCKAIIDRFNIQLTIKGEDKMPKIDESCIIVSNHPLGGIDAIAIVHILKELRPDIKFVVNDLLLGIKTLESKFIGVNKVGKSASSSLQKVEEQFASDGATYIFPAGLVSRKQNGKIEDLEWKKTFVSKSKKYNKRIVPIYINGRLTDRFYRLANFRKFLGLKFNIEMLFLADELFKQENSKINLTIGDPIKSDIFTSDRSDLEWAQWTKEKVYQLNQA
ncbi:MAG: 1-acyl-sn-glycerol-3-phosphate acyltransferase [Cyclobacteriaceae bacterium]